MTKSIEVGEEEQLGYLAEELKDIFSMAYESATLALIEAKYRAGEAIVTHELFKKHAKSQGEFYMDMQKMSGVKLWILQDCVKFYETYPNRKPDSIADEVYTKHGSWRNVRIALYGGDSNAVRKSEEKPPCNHKCPNHCPERKT